MYLSRVRYRENGTARKQLQHVLRNGSYASHQLLWQLFGEHDERNFLFREEQSRGFESLKGTPEYMVLSACKPASCSDILQVETKPFQPHLHEGQRLAFRLRANPTVDIANPERTRRSKRHDVMMHTKKQLAAEGQTDPIIVKSAMDQAAIDWLCNTRRTENLGIRFDVAPTVLASVQQKTIQKKNDRMISFTAVDYEGILTVVEPEKLINSLHKGIGRSKAFGCGMMLIRRV
ncbi:type I-E CRISPR-associated protein Cas6/Cse3/CasE [Photobacterium sp.]|uniref:type I-E CRISPR-associated protein Cas6/Cse3/CasE n=1 Tax=Photobacterium sp. TaxID=660 RepID=UPI00299D8BA1|nr:type I-E CRISPR-associated protein Cas6/Cse3/CasE [Photobacterium sp.]MDX1300827.1 type I-E CRISPR-associated protein Cas6/Cse3/CasE [Photobacterium sp.]